MPTQLVETEDRSVRDAEAMHAEQATDRQQAEIETHSAGNQEPTDASQMRIAMYAVVMCSDGAAGRCSHVIVDPATSSVTHLVVGPNEHLPRPAVPHLADEDDESWHAEHLVPFGRVADATVQGIRLDCTRQELAAMDDFVQRRYRQVRVPDYHNSTDLMLCYAYVAEEVRLVPVDEECIPPEKVAMDRNTRVEATDGEVGWVGELVVEPGSGRITYLVLCADHVWDPKDGAVPAAQIDHLGGGAIYLKLDSRSIASLPAVVMGNSS